MNVPYLIAVFAICTLSAQTKQELPDVDAKIKEHSSNRLTIPQFSGEFFSLNPSVLDKK